MSDLDFVKEWDQSQGAATTGAILGAGGSPDDAARALDLEKVTGQPAGVIVDDLKETEVNAKGALAGDIVNGNQTLRRYINSNPMAQTLSNDDWAVLDAVTRNVAKSERSWAVTRGFVTGLFKQNPELYGEAAEAVGHLLPKDSAGGEALKSVPGLIKSITPELKDFELTGKRLRDVSNAGEALETLGEMFGSGLSSALPVVAGAMLGGSVGGTPGAVAGGVGAGAPLSMGEVYKALKDEGVDKERAAGYAAMVTPIMAGLDFAGIALGPLGGLLGIGGGKEAAKEAVKQYLVKEVAKGVAKGMAVEGLTEAVQEGVKDATVSAASGKSFFTIDTAFNALEAAVGGALVGGALHGPAAFAQQRQQMQDLETKLRPYVAAGQEPPIGLDPAIDKMKVEQSKEDLEELDQQLKDSLKSTTRERSPDIYAQIMEMETQAKVYIPFEQVVRLYGDNVPHPEDGILGWAPGIMEQMRTMSLVNGDIVIPKSEWLARVEPEVAKELHDFIRVRQSGFSREGAKEFSAAEKAAKDIDVWHGSPHTFDAFSMEAIGTGEGAQAYGHGLYFAENPEVAKSYAVGRQTGGTVKTNVPGPFQGVEIMDVKPPSMYRARIKADPEQFVDYDKPLSQQPESVIQALAQASVKELGGDVASQARLLRELNTPAGEWIQQYSRGGEGIWANPPAASKALKEAGIPGIRYLDQGSRRATRAELHKQLDDLQKEWDDLVAEDIVDPSATQAKYGKSIEQLTMNLRRRAGDVRSMLIDAPEKRTYNYVLFDDALIEILDRNGEAVRAVREQGALDAGPRLLSKLTPITSEFSVEFADDLSSKEKLLVHAVTKALDRIAPNLQQAGVRDIVFKEGGGRPYGVYQSWTDALPVVFWSIDASNVLGTARHEAVHYLRRMGYLTEGEWEVLRTAAIEGNWLEKHRINTRYADLEPEFQIEEAIAEEYSKSWALEPGNVKSAVARVFEKIAKYLAEVKEEVAKLFGYTPSPQEIFAMIESGEVGSRTGTKPRHPDVLKEKNFAEQRQGELDVTRQEDKPIFKTGAAIGISQPTLKKLLDLIEKRDDEDVQAQRKRAIEFERKTQTAAWKEESDALEDEVRRDIRNRPDIAASEFFRYGELYGEKLDGRRPKLNAGLLTEEQRKMLPEQWVADDGMHPDDAAGLFGYTTGVELVNRLATVEQVRGNVRPGEFLLRLVKAETQRRMIAKHGELESNILAAAEDHVLGMTQMDLLHEQTLAFAQMAGAEITMTKEQTKEMAERGFLSYPADDVKVQGFLNDSGKAGRKVIEASAKQDWGEAFKHQQAQYYAGLMGRHAVRFEKEMGRLDRLMKRVNKRQVKGVDTQYVNAMQALMAFAGLPTRRSPEEIKVSMEKEGWGTFADFIQAQINDGYEPNIPDSVVNGVKPWKEMTVLDRKEFFAAMRSLNALGRKIDQVEIGGQKFDRAEYVGRIIDNIKSLPKRDPKGQMNFFYRWDAWMARPEEVIKDLDLRERAGPLWNAVYRPLAEAKHQEYSWEEKLVKRLNKIKGDFGKEWLDNLATALPNDFFIDPHTDQPFNMTRGQMVNIMLNWGNRSNIEKFTIGWFGKDNAANAEAKVKEWIDTHATKQDWEFVQHIWDIFEDWKGPATEMYQRLAGVGPKMIPAEAVQTPHGEFKGGYFPIIKDHLRNNTDTSKSGNALFAPTVMRSTPANSYTVTRTGAAVKVSFEYPPETLAARMRQEIHDISFREPLVEVWKIFKDNRLRNAIKQHYGAEYEAQIDPWLKRIASSQSLDEQANGVVLSWLRRARTNVVGHALPLNLRVILSPDVGLFNPADVARVLADREKYVEMAWKNSKEIPHTFRNMDRDFREQLEAMIVKRGFRGAQANAVRVGFIPMAKFSQGFRIITFVTEFEKHLAAGKDEGTAASLADSTVRERHGSGGVVDMSAMMGANDEGIKIATMFMGFFNMSYNWARQVPGAARRGDYRTMMEALYGSVIIGALFGAALFNKWEKDDNWFKFSAKALTLQAAGVLPFGREAASLLIEGRTPSTPWGSIIKAVTTAVGDVKKVIQGKKVEKPIQHGANVIGLTTGLPMAQAGRTGQFAVDVYTGKQRPQTFGQYLSGIIHGEAVRK